MDQSVAAGSTVEEGTSVNITLSQGSSTVQVPDVRWGTLAEARDTLSEYGLYLSETREYDDSYPEGTVIGQDTSPGSRVERGSTIGVTVSAGPEPTEAPETDPPETSTEAPTQEDPTEGGDAAE